MSHEKQDRQKAAEIVRDAGGEITGRTKFQKVAYFLEIAGYGVGFDFEYRQYGPYSETLANAIRMADVFGLVSEAERPTSWGGTYSVYNSTEAAGIRSEGPRAAFAEAAAAMKPVELELAATAAFLSQEGHADPWGETKRLKPAKADGGRIERAKEAYRQLARLETGTPLPSIISE